MTDNHTHRGDDVHSVEAAEREANGGWQPIETAPKDGPVILLGGTTAMFGVWFDEHWVFWEGCASDVFYKETIASDDIAASLNYWCSGYGPTHWMPLPAAPTEGE
jgi:hypothetical protein